MEVLPSIALIGAGLLALFIGAYLIVTLWKQGVDASPVLLEQVLRRQGDGVARIALASGDRRLAVAVGQCTRCREAAQCRAWLHSGAREGYQTFCPNAGYVQRMKALAA